MITIQTRASWRENVLYENAIVVGMSSRSQRQCSRRRLGNKSLLARDGHVIPMCLGQ